MLPAFVRTSATCAVGDARRSPVLVWRFDAPVRAAATAVLGGGIGERCWVVNAEVPIAYERTDPDEHLREIAEALELPPDDGVGLLTAARVGDVARGTDAGAWCDATVGISAPTWAASSDGGWSEWAPGTINLVCGVDAPLGDGALLNALTTATEAKSQALVEARVPGTGTASDAVVVCCPHGRTERFGGPRSSAGAALARAVHAAVSAGIARFVARRG